jgi:hypothetical protein
MACGGCGGAVHPLQVQRAVPVTTKAPVLVVRSRQPAYRTCPVCGYPLQPALIGRVEVLRCGTCGQTLRY